MKKDIKKYLHFLGGVLGIASLFFVAARIYIYADQINVGRFSSIDWFFLVFLAFAYGASNLLLVLAWRRLLFFLGVSMTHWLAIEIYGVSQLAKYVPGNIFQFAGRQAVGMAAGIPGKPLLKSTLYELSLLASAGGVFALLVVPLLWKAVPALGASLFFLCLIWAAGWGLAKRLSNDFGSAWWLYVFFLLISGALFYGVLWIVSPEHNNFPPVTSILGAYVVAWLLGLVTPGAPAGVGVREAVLLFLLGDLVPSGDLLLSVVIGRLVTVTGDFLFFCGGFRLKINAFRK